MEYVIGALTGVIYGGLIGALKYFLLWKGILHPKDESKITNKMIYTRMMISYVVNIATLLLVYFLRNLIPIEFVSLAIGTAVALSLAGKFFSIQKVYQNVSN